LGPTESVLPENEDRIPSPKRCVLKYKQDGVLDENRTMDNVQKENIYTHAVVDIFLLTSFHLAQICYPD
jgi:hypothetical protein